MENIGIVLNSESSGSLLKDFVKRFKYKILPVAEYGFNFVVVRDDQNCSRIFNKNGVENVVIMTDADVEGCDFKIINGDIVYKRMMPEIVRKTLKSRGRESTIAIVDKNLSVDCSILVDKLCEICNSAVIVTENTKMAEKISEKLMEQYGAVVEVTDGSRPVQCDIAVVITPCGNRFSENCVIIDKNRRTGNRVINDFYIPFRTKPPYGMSNIVFAECLDVINTKIY